jgi:peptidyl-prolyl cis-trans isomerase C
MRDKYVALIEKAKADQKIEIMDETLKKGYDEATKEQQAQPPQQ